MRGIPGGKESACDAGNLDLVPGLGRSPGEGNGNPLQYSCLKNSIEEKPRRDKKAFFNEQCIKIEENNRRRKTRDLFWKIGNTKGIFHPKMGTIKDRSGRDLVDAEEIKKRWKEHTEGLYKKYLNELNN